MDKIRYWLEEIRFNIMVGIMVSIIYLRLKTKEIFDNPYNRLTIIMFIILGLIIIPVAVLSQQQQDECRENEFENETFDNRCIYIPHETYLKKYRKGCLCLLIETKQVYVPEMTLIVNRFGKIEKFGGFFVYPAHPEIVKREYP
jgi:hypothetical protein